jgi:hypothetical protein
MPLDSWANEGKKALSFLKSGEARKKCHHGRFST